MADVQIQKPVEVPEQQPADVPKQEPVEVPKQQPAEVPKQEPTQEPAPAVPDYLSDPDAVLKDVNVKWRYGRPPDYSKTRQVYAQSRCIVFLSPHRAVPLLLSECFFSGS